jgi:hypothetical protein
MVVFVWRLVKRLLLFFVCGVVVVWPMHGVILIFARVDGEANHPSLLIDGGGELHVANGITHVAKFS